MGRPGAVFIDKDGTLVEDVPFNVDPSRIRLASGASAFLAALRDAQLPVFVVSNQPGVAYGYFRESALEAVTRRLEELATKSGGGLAGFYYCPHHPDGAVAPYAVRCDCRKPLPGLIMRACVEHGLDAGRCWMVGDILDDVEAGRRAGCRTIFLDNGHETEWRRSRYRLADATARGLAQAADIILRGRRP